MAKIDFGGVVENVVTREEFPLSKAREVLKNEVVAVIGYGVQGPAQALNMKDNGINVIIGQAPEFKADWDKAVSRWICTRVKLFFQLKKQLQKVLLFNIWYRMLHREYSGQNLNPALKKEMHSISLMVFQLLIRNIPV